MNAKRLKTAVRDERGNVLVIALLLVFATFIIGGAVAMMSTTDMKIASNEELGTEAHFAAEAGVSEAIHRLSQPYPTNVTIGGSTVNISIADTKPYKADYKAYIQMKAPGTNPTFSGNTMTAGTLQTLDGSEILYSQPSGTDDVVTVEHKWEDLDGDGVRETNELVMYDSAQVPPENFVSGNPIEVITVTGRSGATSRTVQAEVTRLTLMAKTLGAFFTDRPVSVSGSSVFCGHNHDIATPVGTTLNACYAQHETSGHLAGIASTGDVVTQKGANKTDGNPAINNANTNIWYTFAETLGLTTGQVAEILANADHTAISSVIDGVTYIQGNATINAGVVGHGLLYVTGDCTINGGFKYWGLIYVEGDCKITGTPWILGSVMVRQSADFNFNSGNCGILYSQESIEQYVGMLMPMTTLAWRDL